MNLSYIANIPLYYLLQIVGHYQYRFKFCLMFTVSDMTVVLYIESLKMNLYISQIISSIISNKMLFFKPIFVSTPLKFNSFLVMLYSQASNCDSL